MSIRLGVTEAEERKLKKAVESGSDWGDIVESGILNDVDYDYVKANLYTPLKTAFDAKSIAADLGDKK